MSIIAIMETKVCNKCGLEKPLTMFNKNNQRKDGLTASCKTCLAILRKKYDKKYNQSAKCRATARRYYYSAQGQKTKKAYRQKYVLTMEQRERYRLAGRCHEKEGKYKERRKRYDSSPKGKATKARKDKRYIHTAKGRFSKRKTAIKRAHQLQATDNTLTSAEWEEIKTQFCQRCAYCHQQIQPLEMDHVIPLSKGGTHTKENVVPACRTCNARKGNREPQTAATFGL